jgi:hypothetical protein
MKRDDLKSCSGYTVQIILDGKEELADLNAEDPKKAFLTCPKKGVWTDMPPYFLSDDDISHFSPNGTHNLFSRIALKSPPPE